MSKYEINYSQEQDYYNKVALEIRLSVKPEAEDAALIQSAIDTIEGIADKYLYKIVPPKVTTTKA